MLQECIDYIIREERVVLNIIVGTPTKKQNKKYKNLLKDQTIKRYGLNETISRCEERKTILLFINPKDQLSSTKSAMKDNIEFLLQTLEYRDDISEVKIFIDDKSIIKGIEQYNIVTHINGKLTYKYSGAEVFLKQKIIPELGEYNKLYSLSVDRFSKFFDKSKLKIKIGELMISNNILTVDQVNNILSIQKDKFHPLANERFLEIAYRLHYLNTNEKLYSAIKEISNYKVYELGTYNFREALNNFISIEMFRERLMLIKEVTEDRVTVIYAGDKVSEISTLVSGMYPDKEVIIEQTLKAILMELIDQLKRYRNERLNKATS